MIIVVNDANILIDLIKLDLLPEFFRLDFEFYTSDFVLDVELNEDQKEILGRYRRLGILKVKESSPAELNAIVELNQIKRKLSLADCSVFLMAVELDGILVTSDNKLRKYSISQHIEVHGHLWVLDRLVDSGLITTKLACVKLDELDVVNPNLKLPPDECQKRRNKWYY